MSPSGAEIIRQIRSQIDELDPSEVKALNGSAVLLDVRESDEWDAGHLPAPSTSRAGTWSRASRA